MFTWTWKRSGEWTSHILGKPLTFLFPILFFFPFSGCPPRMLGLEKNQALIPIDSNFKHINLMYIFRQIPLTHNPPMRIGIMKLPPHPCSRGHGRGVVNGHHTFLKNHWRSFPFSFSFWWVSFYNAQVGKEPGLDTNRLKRLTHKLDVYY